MHQNCWWLRLRPRPYTAAGNIAAQTPCMDLGEWRVPGIAGGYGVGVLGEQGRGKFCPLKDFDVAPPCIIYKNKCSEFLTIILNITVRVW